MKLVDLTDFLIKSVVSDPDMVSVKQIAEDDELITIEVLVNDNLIGSVIGKNGSTINAIRTIVQSSAYANNLKKVRINVDSI